MKAKNVAINLISNKSFMVVVAVIVLVVIIYFMFFGKDEAEKQLQDFEDEQNELEKEGETLSFPLLQYSSYADQIQDNLDKSSIADDKDLVEDVLLRMENTIDVLQLIKAYGKRQRYFFGIPDGSATNLSQTILDEFKSTRINRVNKEYESRFINFQF